MSFKDIQGQDKPIELLKEYIKNSRLNNGYLFIGPEGVGKALAAKTAAKALNCLEETIDSCDRCASCLKIEKNQHPDVHFVDASMPLNINLEGESDRGNSEAIKIDHIRQLRKVISLKPYEGRKKVFILDNAHNLTADASNALLKILEEPPPESLLILISSHPSLLLKTVTSRCRVIKFASLERGQLEQILKDKYGLDGGCAHFLAYFCEGRIGSALQLKDTDLILDKNRVINEFVISPKADLESFPVADKVYLRRCLNILAGWFRDLYILKINSPHAQLINLDRKDDLLKIMNRYTFPALDEKISFISDMLLYLEQNINVKLMLANLRIALWNG